MNGTSGAGLPERLTALVVRAAAEARRSGRRVLVSVSEETDALDPLVALECAMSAAEDDPALEALVASGRMYWSHAASNLAFAAIGAAVVVAPSGAERFAAADRLWRDLLSTAMTDGHHDEPSTGPVLAGGFSFTPATTSGDDWRDFPDAHFIVPALRVTTTAQRHTLTASLVVSPDGAPAGMLDAVLHMRSVVIATHPRIPAVDVLRDGHAALPLFPLRSDTAWRELVDRALAEIRTGSLRKVVLARAERATLPEEFSVIAALAHLRSTHPDAYVFGYWREQSAFIGATPERLLRVTGRVLDASSLAGSAARGASPAADVASAQELLHSAKDLAEHALVLSALRTVLARFADEVIAPDRPSLLTLPNVHHLHTAVRAILRADSTVLEVAGALHPTPAVGGSPRTDALAFIQAHEHLDRGWYAAPIGWIGRDQGELAVALRSALVAHGEALLVAGCGIVEGSDPAAELRESRVKLRAMEDALAATATAAALGEAHPGHGAPCP